MTLKRFALPDKVSPPVTIGLHTRKRAPDRLLNGF